jgi:hypothetical protein
MGKKSTERRPIEPPPARPRALSPDQRLERFDRATARQEARQARRRAAKTSDRGWRREDLLRNGS